jgi:hypothetical protein
VDSTRAELRAKFPASIGILFGIALAAHLAAVIQSIFGEGTSGAALFLLGQAILAFGLLRLINGAWLFQDIRVFFVIFFFLYGGTLPLWIAWSGSHIAGVGGAAFLYGTGLLGFNLVQWWYKQPWRDLPPEVFARIRPSFVNAFLLLLAVAFVVLYAQARGVQLAFRIDRGYTNVLGTQLWVVSMFAMNGLTMFMIAGWSNMSWRMRVVFMTAITIFVMFHLSLGNRRDFLPMFIFLAATIATRRRAVIGVWTVVAGFIAFAAFTLIGIVRQVLIDPTLLRKNPAELFVGTTEFFTPIQTLIHYVTADRPLLWGWTYLSAPSLFIPRSIWADKPAGLSLQFLRDAYGTTAMMGYAYTPVTEAFINFGWVGPFAFFAMMSLLMVKLVRRADIYPSFYLVCFAYVVDFNRGAFGETAYSLVFVTLGFVAMRLVSRLRLVAGGPQANRSPRFGGPDSAQHAALSS